MEALEYRPGVEMRPEPVNRPLRFVASTLVQGNPVEVVLEPGDATRYDLILTPLGPAFGHRHRRLLATRVRSGEPVGATLFYESGVSWPGQVSGVAGGNDWCITFFSWWFNVLFTHLGEAGW